MPKFANFRFFVYFIGLLNITSLVACGSPAQDKLTTPRPGSAQINQVLSPTNPAKAGSNESYVVVLEPGANPGNVARAHGLTPFHIYKTALTGFAAQIKSQGALQGLENNPKVKYVEPDIEFRALGQTLPTGIDRIEADKNSTAGIDGSDERVDADVAILDTGIDLDHPDLNVFESIECLKKAPPFPPECSNGGDDGNGHGSHVAGSVGALDNSTGVVGVAPGTRLWAVKVLHDDGSGSLSEVIAGVDWVTKHADQIEVANMSLGAQAKSDSLRTALQNSVAAGVVYIVAAGNSGVDVYGSDGTLGTSDDTIPAAYPEVAAISALADSDGQPGGNGSDTGDGADDSFASFSNYSQSVVSSNPVNSSGAAIDLILPGTDIKSTWKDGGYETKSGTSMASPHVAGLTALEIAANGRDTDADGDVDATDVYNIRQALIDNGVNQDSSNGLATLNDPDSNWEHLGWAETQVGDSPAISWSNPTDGATVSGSVTIKINASDTEDSDSNLTVEWRVDGNSWRTATYDSNCSCYTDSWDSTTTSDGSHNLDARATDSDGNSSTSSITVTTDNTDDAPSVSWVNPADGDTVSGTVNIQISAADSEDADDTLTVEYRIDSGTWRTATYNSTSGYYEDSWDTTTLADGDHVLDARATDSAGNSTTSSITVTTENTDDPPSASWVNPIDGETVSGTVNIQIDAADDRDSGSDLTVEWQLDDGTWRTASFNSSTGYYEDSWDTTNVSDSDHTLDTRATDTGGNTSSESGIAVTVDNKGNNSMYVWDIAFSEKVYGGPHGYVDLTSTVTLREDTDNDGAAESSDEPVANASIDYVLTRDSDGDGSFECGGDDTCWSFSGETDSNGQVSFTRKKVSSGDYRGEVTGATHSTYNWDSNLDADNPDYHTVP